MTRLWVDNNAGLRQIAEVPGDGTAIAVMTW